VRTFQDELAQNPGFVQVDTDLRLNKPEIRLEVDRERAADLGVGVEVVAPRELNHFGQRRSATITANLSPNYSVGEALDYMDTTAKKVLKVGYATDLNGSSREFCKSSDSLALVFVLALVFIFLVLAAQFESSIDPFVILLSVPLSMVGALPLALATGAGAESREQIGWVIVGGMGLGTLLTVFVVPTMYTLFARKHAPGAIKEETLKEAVTTA